jgi:hypothetical protein
MPRTATRTAAAVQCKIRLPVQLHRQLTHEATAAGVTLNRLIVDRLTQAALLHDLPRHLASAVRTALSDELRTLAARLLPPPAADIPPEGETS